LASASFPLLSQSPPVQRSASFWKLSISSTPIRSVSFLPVCAAKSPILPAAASSSSPISWKTGRMFAPS
jgi:hypothetical protein